MSFQFGDARVPQRFWSRVTKDVGGCWLWTRPMPDGYGRIRYAGKGSRFGVVHRFIYERVVSPIKPGLQLDHLCRVRNCVNPAHLEQVTPRENTLRGNAPSARNAIKTHCPSGHPYNAINTYTCKRGTRMCRVCAKNRMRQRRGYKGSWSRNLKFSPKNVTAS